MTINRVESGEFVVIIRAGDVLMRVADLEGAGVHGFAGHRERIGPDEFVSLSSLAPGVAFEFDTEAVALRLTFPPALLGTTVVKSQLNRPENILYSSDTTVFVNYAVNWRDLKKVDGFSEAGLSLRGNLLYSSLSYTADGKLVRGQTNYTVDDRLRLRRWVVGDTFAAAGGLGGAVFLAGLSVSRNFDLDPYFIRYPTLAVSGALTTPSTVEVYLNGAVVRRAQLPPGQFDFTDLVPPAGNGTAQIVIRDAFGQQRTLTNPFYASTAVLAKGLSEFTYNLGFQRNRIGVSSFDYQSLVFLGRHRFGLTNSLTPEMRLEAGHGVVSGGPGWAVRLPIGELEGYAAASRDGSSNGAAGALSYRYIGRPVNFGGFARALSPRYANLSLPAASDRARLEVGAFGGVDVTRRVSLTAQYSSSRMRDSASNERLSLSSNIRLTEHANLILSGARSRRGGVSVNEGFAGLSYFVTGTTTASVSYDRHGDGSASMVQLQRALPVGNGFGYRLSAADGAGSSTQNGLFEYQGPYGLYQLSADRVNGQEVTTLSASGGVVAIGGTVSPRRAVGDSFALIRVPDVQGVTGLASNSIIGKTNSRGDLLVPDLLSYYGNRLSIADQDVPLNYEIQGTERIVAPPYRGGAVVAFPVVRIQGLRGLVVLQILEQDVPPAFGQLTVTVGNKLFESPLGRLGEFYFENLPVGGWPATVESKQGQCAFTLRVPASDQPFLDVGTVRCSAADFR